MNYFDFLETRFTEANTRMATGNPNDVTVPRQAQVNAALQLVGLSRSFLKWYYVMKILGNYLLIRLRIVRAPKFQSSIPNQLPNKPASSKPELKMVKDEQPPSA